MIELPFTAFLGGLFGSSSGTAVLFGQQQTTERIDQNAGSPFNTPLTLSATRASIFGQSSGGQTVCVVFTISYFSFMEFLQVPI